MALIDKLKKENMIALKEGNKEKRGVLSIVINKYTVASTDEKFISKGGVSDEDLVSIIMKVAKELEEEKQNYQNANRLDNVNAIKKQIDTLREYLPKLLSEDEIQSIINTLNDKSMPAVMKHFKENYQGKVDMGLVSKLARNQ